MTTSEGSSAASRAAALSNQNKHVICAASSARLPWLLLTVRGIWRHGAICRASDCLLCVVARETEA